MADPSPLIRSLRLAVAANADDIPLRLHLAELLLDSGDTAAAIVEIATALQTDPTDATALSLMARATAPGAIVPAAPVGDAAPAAEPVAEAKPPQEPPTTGDATTPDFDWKRAESELNGVVPPKFAEPVTTDEPEDGAADFPVETSTVTLADVAGMAEAKQRLEASFLAPIRNPKLVKLFGKSLRGGLLLYGPPGCGKTFIARAVAGELGASFINVTLNDVLDHWLGKSEQNLHEIFETARSRVPCVVFFDELDAIGAKRNQVRGSGMRNVVNYLLGELDGVTANNEGMYVMAATNYPWDVDSALRRPGRFDRTVLVTPPDPPAREQILRLNLKDRPVVGIDTKAIAKVTDGYSGADLAHVCELATERALMDSVASGEARMINQSDLLGAVDETRPSGESWFTTARNVAMFGNEGGTYDDLVKYLKKMKKW